jgi:hypothetical protein
MRLALSLAVVAVGVSACSLFDESPPPRTEPVAQAPARPPAECLVLANQGLTALRRSSQGATADWRVQVQNPCPQPASVLVEFWVLDRNNAAVGYEARRVTAPPSAAFETVGQIVVPRQQSRTIAATAARIGGDAMQPAASAPAASPALAASPAPASPALGASAPAAFTPTDSGDRSVTVSMGAMAWQGNAAMVPVEVLNRTSAPTPQLDLTCQFVALGRVLGTDVQRVPALRPGERATITVISDVGGEPIDSVRCTS